MKVQTIWVQEHIVFPVRGHNHGYYQMIYCKKAGGFFEIGEEKLEAEPEKVYFIQPMQYHSIDSVQGMHLMEVKFVVQDEAFARQLSFLPSCFTPQDMGAFRRSVSDILKEGRSQELYCNEATNAALELMLIRLIRPYVEPVQEVLDTHGFSVPISGLVGKQNRIHAQMAQLIHWIEDNMTENITLDTMCKLVHMEKSTLVDCFNRICGMSPIKYVNWVRMEKARELLVTTDKSITDVAKESGFGKIHYFCRYFKSRENMTPVEYRIQKRRHTEK